MVTPLSLITRTVRSTRRSPALGRCPVCNAVIRDPAEMFTLRGGIHVHRACATYRIRQRARAF
ncbi:MAG TPA: hypothetical protein VH247_10890 [Thermoleophilaceae bacterium]|jgi:hypothetical protein|nr:hypothetical protein [Thermoleophilaceae bacterium]